VERSNQRTFDPLAVEQAPSGGGIGRLRTAQRSTMHLQKTPLNGVRTTSDFAEKSALRRGGM